MSYTLGEAAKACGKSKSTLSKAIKAGKISAEKQVDGSFSIQPAELHRVYPPVSSTPASEQQETLKETPVNTSSERELIELRVRLEAAEQRISDLEKDKDDWKQQATRLLAFTPQAQPQGFFSKLFRK
jgi:hypothetical protein